MFGKASWYEVLFGLAESSSYSAAQKNFVVNRLAGTITSKANGKEFQVGTFYTPSLRNLRDTASAQLKAQITDGSDFKFDHVVQGDVLLEHANYPGAVFQAASQFNCLEFSSWKSLPENGLTIYAHDRTQGPACALACAAGTVYRNYFADVYNMPGDVDLLREIAAPPGSSSSLPKDETSDVLDYSKVGQMEHRQLNNLDDLEKLLYNADNKFFNVLNGYTFSADGSKLDALNEILADHKRSATERTISNPDVTYEDLLGAVKIGLHEDVGVTFRKRSTPAKE